MKRARTLYTVGFEASKRLGFVVKCGKCRFMDGRREYERTMWYDKSTDEFVIMLNGNAYPFKPYSAKCQAYAEDYIIGRI